MSPVKSRSRKIRVVTLNVKGLENDWFGRRCGAVINGLKKLRPDVVCLQEATVRSSYTCNGSNHYDQARVVREGIGLKASAFAPYGNPIEVMSHDQGGVAILARWPIINVHNRRLPSGCSGASDARVALVATVDCPERPLSLVTTHLSWRPHETETRLMQTGLILEEFTRTLWTRPKARAVFLADLNATEDEPAVELCRKYLVDAFRACNPDDPGHTWSNKNTWTKPWSFIDRRIDYVFCPTDATVLKARVVLDKPDPIFASDHFGVLADILFH